MGWLLDIREQGNLETEQVQKGLRQGLRHCEQLNEEDMVTGYNSCGHITHYSRS